MGVIEDIINKENVTIDKELEIPKYSPVCSFCQNLNLNELRQCMAFKNIPMDIWLGDNKHLKPLKNQDNDIIFEGID